MSNMRSTLNRFLVTAACCLLAGAVAWGQSAPTASSASKPVSAATMPASSPATTPASAPGEIKVTISGKVVDAAGKGVEGAQVQAHFMNDFAFTETQMGNGVSKADGTFEIPVTLAPRRQWGMILAKKAGMAIGWDNYDSDGDFDAAQRQPCVITLGKPAVLEGTVVDETGAAVANADVRALLTTADRRKSISLPSSPQLRAVSDDKGQFRIEDVPSDCLAEIEASAPHKARITTIAYDSSDQRWHFRPGQADIKITLPPACRIEGTIIDKASGKPIAAVGMMATATKRHTVYPFTCKSDKEGRFAFDHLAAGKYSVGLQSQSTGQIGDWVAEAVTVEAIAEVATMPSATAPAPLKIEASRGGIAEIVIVDAADGRPIPQGSLSVTRGEGNGPSYVYASAYTDQAGIAKLRLLPGAWKISAIYAKGYQGISSGFINLRSGVKSLSSAAPIAVSVTEGQTSQTTVKIKSVPKFSGIVKDSAGQVVAGAAVHDLTNSTEKCTTGSDGRFAVSVGQTYQYDSPGRTPQTPCIVARHVQRNLAAVVEVPDAAKPIEVMLAPAGTVTGLVIAPDGKPIAHASVAVLLHSGNMGIGLDWPLPQTGADGRFEETVLPTDQKYSLEVSAEGYGRFEIQPGKLEINAGKNELPSITLPVADQSVSGIVVDAEDKAVPNVRVTVYGDNQPRREAVTTDKDGKFEIAKVVAGSLQLNAWDNDAAGGQRYGTAKANGGDKDVRIVLRNQSSGGMADAAEARRPLVNKPLPKLEELGLKADSELAPGKQVLVCFFDRENRASRRTVQVLSQKSAELESKGVVVVLVHAGSGDAKPVRAWLDQTKITLPLGTVASNAAKMRAALANWGVGGQPWLILADRKHIVTAEGFPVDDLDKVLSQAPATPAAPATKPTADK